MPLPFCNSEVITCIKYKDELELNWKILSDIRKIFCCASEKVVNTGKYCNEFIVEAGVDRLTIPDDWIVQENWCNWRVFINGVRYFNKTQTIAELNYIYDNTSRQVIFSKPLGDIIENIPCIIFIEYDIMSKISDIFACPITQSSSC